MCFNSRSVILAVVLGSFSICLFSCSEKKTDQPSPIPLPYTGSLAAPTNSQTSPEGIIANGEQGKPQSVDVISGKPVNRSVFGDYNGQRVYFCCPESKKTFDANTQAYLEAIRKQGIILDRAN
jgi:YHS domain-containing protein